MNIQQQNSMKIHYNGKIKIKNYNLSKLMIYLSILHDLINKNLNMDQIYNSNQINNIIYFYFQHYYKGNI